MDAGERKKRKKNDERDNDKCGKEMILPPKIMFSRGKKLEECRTKQVVDKGNFPEVNNYSAGEGALGEGDITQ